MAAKTSWHRYKLRHCHPVYTEGRLACLECSRDVNDRIFAVSSLNISDQKIYDHQEKKQQMRSLKGQISKTARRCFTSGINLSNRKYTNCVADDYSDKVLNK